MAIGGTGLVETGLGGPIGLGEIEIPRSDDGSFEIDVSSLFRNGLRLFGKTFVDPKIYVNTNGTLSIGAAVSGYPSADLDVSVPIIAPFWGDVDTRLDSEGSESGAIWADIDTNSGVLSVTWSDVGVYRRNADQTNTFQLQLYDTGNGNVDIAFRYQKIEWETGTADDDTGAMVGIFDPDGVDFLFGGTDLFQLPDSMGNGGVQGLWAYSFEEGQLRDYFRQTSPKMGSESQDVLSGTSDADHLLALGGDDTLDAGNGSDTIDAGDGDDFVFGGYGNDEIYGREGDDNLLGGFGADRISGDEGSDILTGSARSDVILGGNGDDFLNGGWGHDILKGGSGADRFYHEGILDHGSDWITDFYDPEGDELVFGRSASSDDFLVQYAETTGAGAAGISEAFITYIPTGQILWAIEDGILADQISICIEGVQYDLI